MYRKELRYYFSTPIAYIVIGLYQLIIGLFLWVIPGSWNIPDSGYAQVDGLFTLSPWLFLLLCPALTMRLFAEEKSEGTWSLLRTKPVSLWRIVTGKYMAVWTVVVIAQLPCIIHYVLTYYLAEPVGNIDSGAFFGSYIGLFFISAAFCAVGMWASSLSPSQIVAFIIGLAGCFLMFYGFDLIASMFNNGAVANAIEWIGISSHYKYMAQGVIDLRDAVYFVSVSAIFILLTYYDLHRHSI